MEVVRPSKGLVSVSKEERKHRVDVREVGPSGEKEGGNGKDGVVD